MVLAQRLDLDAHRPDDHNLTSYLNLNNTQDHLNGHFLLNSDDVTYPLEPGTRVTLGRYVTDTTMIEAAYLGGLNWDRRNGTPDFATGANGVGPLLAYWSPGFGPFDTSAFTGSNLQIASYESQFNSFELGVRHAVWGTTSILAGFRYINVGDLFQLASFDDAANTNPNANGFYRTWTNNNLVGFQIGSRSKSGWSRWTPCSNPGPEPEVAAEILERLRAHATVSGIDLPFSANTPYANTIPPVSFL